MQKFTGWEYLLIDAANQFGLDKEIFDERLKWANDNLDNLEQVAQDRGDWKQKPLFLKAVMAIRDAQAGKPSGHMVAMDAICSGMQIMSTLTGCKAGALATGLVDPDIRADAYTETTAVMNSLLGTQNTVPRLAIKNAVMPMLYGSRKEPEKVFGEDTPELDAFYRAVYTVAPGACELLSALLQSWQPDTLAHEWTLPDGFQAKVKVMVDKKARLEVNEINSSFTYIWHENEPVEKAVKNAANVIHSVDAYILRSLIRRCSYDADTVQYAYHIIEAELLERVLDGDGAPSEVLSAEVEHYLDLYSNTRMVDSSILPYLDPEQLQYLTTEHLQKLFRLCDDMLQHDPFDIITIHDDFKCHPNNMNHLRNHYRNILADLADADYLSHVFSELHGRPGQYIKRSDDLGDLIRQSNYALS